MQEWKFRGWQIEDQSMYDWEELQEEFEQGDCFYGLFGNDHWHCMPYIGVRDSEGKDYYVGDIGQFPNGDKFEIKMENWLEIYCDWIGEPDCEDQTRDLYRISNAKIIGRIYPDT